MNRMDKVFGELARKGQKILVLYFPIGDPIFDDDLKWADIYYTGGATVLEIGLPVDDPIYDGKTIKDSMARVNQKTNHEEIFATIKKIRIQHPDRILQFMTYFSNIENYGMEKFAEICQNIGIDAVLSPDAPLNKLLELDKVLGNCGIYNLRFVPYHLSEPIIDDLKKNAKGYIFQQAVDGATGQQKTVSPQIRENVKTLKAEGITTPIIAGFGISNAEQAKEALSMGADGVVVGSAAVTNIAAGVGIDYIKSLGEAMK